MEIHHSLFLFNISSMRVDPIGERGQIVSFPELGCTNLYLIYGPRHTFLCDTYLGPDPMEEIKALLATQGRTQPVIVFNSHKDWDHVWGNCAFPNTTILATEQCAANLRSQFGAELTEFGVWAKGDIVPAFPTLLFTGQLFFPEDEVLFFSSPGHTNGSASCFDLQDSVLFLGDNVEYPLPYLYSRDLISYIETLTAYLRRNPRAIITGHGERETMTLDLVRANLTYIKAVAAGEDPSTISWNESSREIHRQNIQWLADHC
jgi:glyoxylase-like metal-dependent hydrolase (beta-lactamase superfamily II)